MTVTRMVSIDPGGVHVGTAWWIDAECYEVHEYGPGEFFHKLEEALVVGSLDVVVMEEFRLYPGKAQEQGYSQMETCEVIGVIKYLVARHGGVRAVRTRKKAVELYMQGASIKKATRGHMAAKKIPNRAVVEKAGGHCADAVLHGQYWLMHRK